jgi:hypothetical protein
VLAPALQLAACCAVLDHRGQGKQLQEACCRPPILTSS